MRAVVVDPEVVFVASLMKADAPALLASFQCDVALQTEDDSSQSMRANLRELKVQACPFIRNKDDKTTTTTVRSQVTYCGHRCSLSATTPSGGLICPVRMIPVYLHQSDCVYRY